MTLSAVPRYAMRRKHKSTCSGLLLPLLLGPAAAACAVLAVCAGSNTAMKIQIDHVTLCGSNLEKMQQALSEAGLTTAYGGPHANGATHMALVGFDDGSYLELIAPMHREAGTSGMTSGWMKLMLADAGACAWAVHTSSIQQEVERLRAAGVAVTRPEPGGRKKIDGTNLRWQTASVGPGVAGALLPFMIQDETPRELRVQPSRKIRETGLTGIAIVVLGVRNFGGAIDSFRKAYGLDKPQMEEQKQFGAKLAYFAAAPVILATPSGEGSWLSERLDRLGDSPVAFLLGTSNINRASQHFNLVRADTWFGRKMAWIDESKLRGARVGVIE